MNRRPDAERARADAATHDGPGGGHRSRAALRELVKGELDGSLREVFACDGERCDRLVRGVLSARGRSLT